MSGPDKLSRPARRTGNGRELTSPAVDPLLTLDGAGCRHWNRWKVPSSSRVLTATSRVTGRFSRCSWGGFLHRSTGTCRREGDQSSSWKWRGRRSSVPLVLHSVGLWPARISHAARAPSAVVRWLLGLKPP